MKFNTYYSVDFNTYQRMNTAELNEKFRVNNLFESDEIILNYAELDRAICGSAVPVEKTLGLSAPSEIAADYFTEHREIGVLNIGGKGTVETDGEIYEMDNRDVLYIGKDSRGINFSSEDKSNPALFYIMSYPAHKKYPTKLAKQADANKVELGSVEKSNKRTIYQYIHLNGIESCQLVMGITELDTGSVWNTMPPHTHFRRSEIYMYFDIPDDAVVFHFMGKPSELRTLTMRNGNAAVSPLWSVHAGAGTQAYTFVWGMGGENQSFDDMDHISMDEIQ